MLINKMSIDHLGSAFISKTLTLLVVVSLLGACQTSGITPLSLDEAKKVTASFKGGFVPPPRTITDITGILEQQKRKDLKTLGQMRVVADEKPPVASNDAELAMFYYKRGEKADHLGRQNQALADYQKAAELFELSNNDEYSAYALEAAAYLTSYLGNYSDAIKGIRKAIKLTRSDWQDSIVSLRYVLAGMAAEAGDFALAEQELKRARPLLNEVRSWDDMTQRGLTIIETLRSTARAMVLAKRGKLDEAEVLMRDAVKRWEPFKNTDSGWGDSKLAGQTYVWYLRHLALILIAQERYVEAEVIAREGLLFMLSDYGRYSSYVASALNLLTKTLLEQGRYEEAEQLAEVTIQIYKKVGVKPESWAFNDARGSLADILVAQGKWQEALEIYTQIERDLATDPATFEQYFASNLNRAVVQFNTDNITAAATTAENIYERNKSLLGEEHYVTAEALGFLAATQVVTKDDKAALSNFRNSVPVLVSRSRQSQGERDTEASKKQRLGLILESYIHLLSKIGGTSLEREAGLDAIAEAFRIADLSRGRSVQSALNASSARATIKDPELANLARREQDAQKQVSVLYGHLANLIRSEPSLSNASATKDIQTRIDDLSRARAALMEEIEGRFPDYAQLINPKPPTIKLAQSTLSIGESLISTYVGPDRTYVWAIPHSGEVAFSSVDLGREDVKDSVARVRAALNPDAETLGDIPEYDLAEAYSLYEKLLKPVEAGWKRAKSLLIVAHGPLGYLPLSLLPTEPASLDSEEEVLFKKYQNVPWLVRTHAVTMLPSVTSLLALRKLPAGNAARKAFVGFGDPWFNKKQAAEAKSDTSRTAITAALEIRGFKIRGLPVHLRAAPTTSEFDSAELGRLPRLPDTADELRAMALALKADLSKDLFLGARASEGLVKTTKLSDYRVISFATHGLIPGDLNGLSQPALALSAPDVANDPGNDGLLTMGEILGLKLDADWVVLSACNTGSADGAGAEAVSGLGRAFFYAGTRALLVSNWPVETTSAVALTSELFKRWAANDNLSRAEALRQSMHALIEGPGFIDIESGKIIFSYAHPIFWAPFSLVGDGAAADEF